MISTSEILKLIGQPLTGLGLNIAWPNEDTDYSTPFLAVDHVPVSAINQTLDTSPFVAGFVQVTHISAAGVYSTAGNDAADAIAALYPAGLRLSGNSGFLVIMEPALVEQGYRDGSNWRVPIKITYRGM